MQPISEISSATDYNSPPAATPTEMDVDNMSIQSRVRLVIRYY